MKSRLAFRGVVMALLVAAALPRLADAGSVTYTTPLGVQNESGAAVPTKVTFTTAPDLLTITISNLLVGEPIKLTAQLVLVPAPLNVEQNTTAVDPTSTNGTPGDSYSLPSSLGTGFIVCMMCPTNADPTGPLSGLQYMSANGSIADNGPTNPFVYGPVTFTLSIMGLTSDFTVDHVTLSLATTPGVNVVNAASVPAPLPLTLLSAGFMAVLVWRRRRKA